MAAFVSGLLGGFGKSYLDREAKKHDEALQETQSRKRILETVMNNPDTRPEDRQRILSILLTPGQEKGKGKGAGKGKQQGGDALQQFLDKLGGMGTGTTPPFTGAGGGTGTPQTGGGSGGGQGGATATPAAPMSEKTPIGGSSTQIPPSALSVGPVPTRVQASSPMMVIGRPQGLVEPGNINLANRPIVRNADGTHSSEFSISIGTDKGEVLIPTVVNGKFLTPDGKKPAPGSQAEKTMFDAAKKHYEETGEHLGIFSSPEAADAYAQQVHNRPQNGQPRSQGQPGASTGATQGNQAKNGSQSLSVSPVPQKGIFLSQEEKEQQELDLEKRRFEQVTKPQLAEESRLRLEEDKLKETARQEYEGKVEKARQDREDARQKALDVRQKNQQGFQERMEKLKETASSQRQMDHDVAMLRLTDVKAADALEKQAGINRSKNVSETIRTLQQQITSSTSLLKSRESEAAKQPWYQFWKDAPDTAAAQEDIDNAKAALTFLTDHKTAIISGKEDLDEITDKTEDILRNGQPEWSRGDWQKANPGKDVKAAEVKAMKQGMKVVP